MLFFKSKKKSEIEAFFEQEDVSIKKVIENYGLAPYDERKKISKHKKFKELLERSTSDEMITLFNRSLVDTMTALYSKKVKLSDIFNGNVSDIGLHSFVEFADDELILKYLKDVLLLMEEYSHPPILNYSIKLDYYLTLNVKSDIEGEIVLSISDSHGVYYINLENLHTVSFYLDKIFINDVASQYSFDNSSKFDSARIKSLLDYLHAKSVANSKRCCVA